MRRSKLGFYSFIDIDLAINIFSQVDVSASEHRRSHMLFQMDAGRRWAEKEAMRKLDVLENHLVLEGQVHEGAKGGGVVMDTGAGDSEVKVRGTLLRHIDA